MSKKVHYAPKVWRGALPIVLLLVIAAGVVGGIIVAPTAIAVVGGGQVQTFFTNLSSAQDSFYKQHGHYAGDLGLLDVSSSHLVSGSIVAACPTGWVAKASLAGVSAAQYASSVSSTESSKEGLKLPDCITAGELTGTDLGYKVNISNVKVTRSKTTGIVISGSVNSTREGARISWTQSNTCSTIQTPVYKVSATRIYNGVKTAASSATVAATHADLPMIQNGMSYQISVSAACAASYPFAAAKVVSYQQPLPASNGSVIVYNGSKFYPNLGRVSSSSHVSYEFQYRNGSYGAWTTFYKGYTGYAAINASSYYPSTSYQTRVRAYTNDGAAYSPWSVGHYLKAFSGSGTSYYAGY